MIMELFEAIQRRKSTRSLLKIEIPMDDLHKIVDAGRLAPSGMNRQPYEFIIIRNPETISKLSTVQGFIREASAAIAIVADKGQSKYWLEDISAAAENMFLAITALEYDSCWIEGTLLRKEEEAKSILEVPADKRLVILLPIGKSAVGGSQAIKKSMAEITYYEKYGQNG
jgi:nitroreductase